MQGQAFPFALAALAVRYLGLGRGMLCLGKGSELVYGIWNPNIDHKIL